MDNQQETLRYYIAGLFEGEGSIYIAKVMIYGKQLTYRGAVQFTNTEPEICQKFIDYLKIKNLNFHIRKDVRKGKKTCYQIQITKSKDRRTFLEDIIPLMVGKKRLEAQIVIKLLDKIDELKVTMPMVNTNGCYQKNNRFEEYEKLYQEYKSIKDSSETKCDTPFIG